MKRYVPLVMLLWVCCALHAYASASDLGYSVSTKGYALGGISAHDHAELSLHWRPAGGAAAFSAAVAVPAGDRWLLDAVASAGIEVVLYSHAEHLFTDLFTRESRYAPSVTVSTGMTVSASSPWFLAAGIDPLRFETGGGYLSVLAPTWYLPISPRQQMGWGIDLVTFGFYLRGSHDV
ncbi:MAG: hypothetical protein K9M84_13115 [Spirochaetia bacterium]|nr:hypothetical protein [Spirochaetia bacterium]MCF7942547.1 hypothetical protein [Spirochaetia bacterium]